MKRGVSIDEKEIARWKERLRDPSNVEKLEKFQKVIEGIFEDHRRRTEGRLIRFVCPRPEVKSLKSVVDKIKRGRKKQGEEKMPYDFDNIEDLAGIKVLCPYPSSAEEVMNWMFKQTSDFRVKPTSIKEALETKDTGYRGWHFVAEPNITSHRTLMGAKCEIQVKTMLQEAWDAQTHDISYKKERRIDKGLLDHIKNQSVILQALDKQSEIIRQLIEHVEEEEREHKRIAATHYLYSSMSSGLFDYCRDNCGIELQPHHEEVFPLSPDKLTKVNKVIECYRNKKGVDKKLIKFTAFIALNQGDAEQEEVTLSLARDFVNSNPQEPDAEDSIAGVYWALNRFDEAIKHGEEAINKAMILKIDPDPYQDNFCYWVAEAVRAQMDVDENHREQVLKYSEYLSQKHPANPKYLDTVAFVKIVLGTKKEEIVSGLNLTRDARELAEKSDEITQKLACVFSERHERLAFCKINQIYQGHKT